ncbi:MAG: hypothetical protein JWN10_2191 [Solirubrobacterales bacterium]|nr:hypothetical protein [Solirubrobacterales bacterium]
MRLGAAELQRLALGTALLGAGGGGDPAAALLMAQMAVEQHGPVTLLDVAELRADTQVLPCGTIGSPTIAEERMWNGDEGRSLCEAVAQVRGRRVDVLMPLQIGGANGLLPVLWAARLGLPLLDADGTGRAFPQLHQQTMSLAGVAPSPVILTDGRGNTLQLDPGNGAWAEHLARGALAGLGGVCAAALCCMDGEQARRATIAGSLSRAVRLGEAMQTDVRERLAAVRAALAASVLIEGRIQDVEYRPSAGFARGAATIVGGGEDAERRMRLEFQSEFLLALEEGSACATVPDLICVLSSDALAPIGVEQLRHGQQVTVLASPSPHEWQSDAGIAMVGPAAFGYEVSPASLPPATRDE